MTELHMNLDDLQDEEHSNQPGPNEYNDEFQNVFDFPDFIEMRPILRNAVRILAEESFNKPFLPVEASHRAVELETKLEKETRKYADQKKVYPNQLDEWADLTRLYTNVLQVISRPEKIDTQTEDLIYAVDQTRKALRNLPKMQVGVGELYDANAQQKIKRHTFYDFLLQELVVPYIKDKSKDVNANNLTDDGQIFLKRISAYVFRDWDAYLTHKYDDEHILKNKRNLSYSEYYDQLEQLEIKYADKEYSDVISNCFREFEKKLVPQYIERIDIFNTVLPEEIFVNQNRLHDELRNIIKKHFLIDENGYEHVMDAPINAIKQKYKVYKELFN